MLAQALSMAVSGGVRLARHYYVVGRRTPQRTWRVASICEVSLWEEGDPDAQERRRMQDAAVEAYAEGGFMFGLVMHHDSEAVLTCISPLRQLWGENPHENARMLRAMFIELAKFIRLRDGAVAQGFGDGLLKAQAELFAGGAKHWGQWEQNHDCDYQGRHATFPMLFASD